MRKRSTADARRSVLLSFVVLGLLSAVIVLPYMSRTEAVSNDTAKRGLLNRTESHVRGFENYDIRLEKGPVISESLLKFRRDAGKTASAIADVRDNFVRGEQDLRTRVNSVKFEYSDRLQSPEVITPDVYRATIERLTGPSREKNGEALRNFAKQYNNLVGLEVNQIDQLKVTADYTNPRGNMAFAHLAQEINGIPVFAGELKAGFTVDGEIVRVINNLAPGLDYGSLSTDFGDPLDAVRSAAGHINYKLQRPDVTRNDAASTDMKVVFGEGPSATTAERMYFPTEIGVARPAWRVLIWLPVNAFYVIVDAETGTMLWRKNITEDQTQSATYEVYDNTNAFMNAADSPAPLTPGPIDPGLGTQGPIGTRTNVTLIGNEGPLSFNNNGWMTDGANGTDGHTDGNHTEAGLDIDGTDGVDAPMLGTGRVFSSAWNPPPGNPAPGDAPTTADSRFGAVVQMFYVMNRYHDALYQLGFTEQAFNFQDDNFGRGGAGGDRIRSEGQDSSGTNNANMSTPADGGRGRMQMFRFTGSDPDRDGTADGDIIVHETTHGTSNRLHGNTAGLGTNMARGMGEGWSDFYAHALLSEPSDPINGVYTTGGYATLDITAGFNANYYYGIRRFPKAVLAFTGGPGNDPHNPLTFADLNAGCDLSDGAFPRGPIGSSTCDQVHNAGEVWSSHLWEVRALMINRLGFSAGNEKALQVVTDGMKLAPLNPTFIQERDAIIAAAAALPAAPESSADVADVREGFRLRGMGFSAEVISASPANVVEAFDTPNVRAVDPITVSDASGDNDGFPEPGETVTLSVPVTNPNTGATITNVNANVNGGTDVSYGDIADGATVTRDINYAIPGGEPCGSFHTVQINVTSDEGAQAPFDFTFRLGEPVGGPPTTFENTTPMDLPAGQPATTSGPADPYPSAITVSGLTGNKVISVELNQINHTWVGDLDMLLEDPNGNTMVIMSDAFSANNRTGTVVATLTLRDDAMDEMTTSGVPPMTGTFKPFNSGTTDTFDAPAPGGPYEHPAPGGSATFLSTFGMDGSTMNGDWNLWIDDDAGADPGTMDGGWKITFESDDYTCSVTPSAGNGRADFDGDGRTDVSVFRPSEGNWYLNKSTYGFAVMNWGLSGDTLVPGDYDGDGKTDMAVFRPDADSANPDFYILNSSGFTVSGASWGVAGDVPIIGDYDGDGSDDIAVFRDSDTTWYILNSGGGATFNSFGTSGDTPMVGDFDGDGMADPATFNAGTWNHMLSGGGSPIVTVGAAGDIPMTGDFDGDGNTDQATWRDSDGTWRIWLSGSGSELTFPFGTSGDIPVPGDYDGDGTDDVAVYRGSGDWWILSSQSGTASVTNFGLASDLPIPSSATP
ncbi:MAG: hypothetical protein HKN33_12835 [Pyrinomonadaceae bacterium]|nr:hypothetical protein [Pyrinomonadaceae bacterium]